MCANRSRTHSRCQTRRYSRVEHAGSSDRSKEVHHGNDDRRSAPTLDETAVQGLAAACAAISSSRGDSGYDEARKVYNAMIDKPGAHRPLCSNVADVIAAVNFARDNDVLVAVRGGGHNGPGWARSTTGW